MRLNVDEFVGLHVTDAAAFQPDNKYELKRRCPRESFIEVSLLIIAWRVDEVLEGMGEWGGGLGSCRSHAV